MIGQLVRWLNPPWGQLLCFWLGSVLLAGALSDRLTTFFSVLVNFDAVLDAQGFREVGIDLLATGLALLAMGIWQKRF